MKRALLILVIAALALPTAAFAKGPSAATVDGPGGGDGITFGGDGESGGTPLGDLAQGAGFFPAVFERQPDPMLDKRPPGNLGLRYTITWTVPGPNNETWKILQDVYPYAEPGPVTYMKPGQAVFHIRDGTRGGWFQATSRLQETLVSAGLPARPVAGSTDTAFSNNLFGLVAVALFLMAATAIFLRRRTRPATA